MSAYRFIDQPAPLAGMSYPYDQDWDALAEQGYTHVVRLCSFCPPERPPYDPRPLTAHHATEHEDLFHGGPPSDPPREEQKILEAAGIVAERLQDGEGVIVHCVGGTGRTGTVVACVLIRLGWEVEDAITKLKAERPGWPESDWQEQLVRSCGNL